MPELSPQTRDKLKKVATPTLMTALYRRGLRNQWIQDVHLINPAATPMVGIAFTLRSCRRERTSTNSRSFAIAIIRKGRPSSSVRRGPSSLLTVARTPALLLQAPS